MNTNNSDPKTQPIKESQDKQLDAIAKLAILSLTWSLADLSKKNRSNSNSERAAPEIHINLSGLKEIDPSSEN
jgi:hypothetical protein